MNRLNYVSDSRLSIATPKKKARRPAISARAEIKREEETFRQIMRTPVPFGFFSMLSNAKHLSRL
jgi:hypothetical protein